MFVSNRVTGSSESSVRARPFLAESIAERAENRLRANAYLALKNISCDFQDGVLTLRGCLPSYYLKQVAQEVVATTDGVKRIENQIEVLGPSWRQPNHV